MDKHILIIEDDPDIVALLQLHLKDLGYHCQIEVSGKTGLAAAEKGNFDLMVLDIMLPEVDGLSILRRVRAKSPNLPILMLTARSEEIDKVLGLEMGADDYMTKPFSVREFIARVKTIFRRMEAMSPHEAQEEAPDKICVDRLCIDLDRRRVTLDDQRIELSPKEFELLSLLASNPGKSYDRNRLLNLIWGYDYDGFAHTVNSHINRLRAKIEPDLSKPKYILTTWGVGYRFNEEL